MTPLNGRSPARLRFGRRQRVLSARLLHPVGHREPDQGVDHVLPLVPPGQRRDDGGLGAGQAVREQPEDGGPPARPWGSARRSRWKAWGGEARLLVGWVLSRSVNPQLLQGFAPRRRLWPGPIASSTSTHPLPPHGSPPADRRDRRAARPPPVHHLSGAGAQPLPRRGPRVLRLLPPERPGPGAATPAASPPADPPRCGGTWAGGPGTAGRRRRT